MIRVDGLNKSGFEIYKEMRKNYNIQLELAETNIVLAILAIGSTKEDVDKFCSLSVISMSKQLENPTM